jgi:endonuclease G, mitochondrial
MGVCFMNNDIKFGRLTWVLFILVFSLSSAFSQLPGNFIVQSGDTTWTIHVAAGVPVDSDSTDELLICRPQYVLSFCPEKNTANWVAWNLNSSWYGDFPRYKGNFISDTLIPDTLYRVKHSDYTNSGYNRGHMVRSEERTSTAEDNKSTFFLSNVIPQTPDLNQGVWLKLEMYCENMCKEENKNLFIYSGGIFFSDSTLKGEGKVAVPDSCFKIIMILNEGESPADATKKTRVIAVVMPNIHGIRKDSWEHYVTTVRHIEQSTGYDFFSNLEEELEEKLETKRFW